MLTIGKLLIPHRLIMAPMCGITLKPFRRLIKRYGAGLVTTQMVSARALVMGDHKTEQLLAYDEAERPIAFQLFGSDPDELAEAARRCEAMGADLVDLNMGCPAKKIVQGGGGSALLKDHQTAELIFQKMRDALHIPFTVKMRAGWDKYHGSALEMARMAEANGVDAVALHARTRAQGYSGSSDWNLITALKQTVRIPVIGNGDVQSLEDIAAMRAQTGCDAVMVGRQAMVEPWIFRSFVEQTSYQPSTAELQDMVLEQYEDSFAFHGQEVGLTMMRKHLCCYTKGLRNGAQFRNQLVRMSSWPEIKIALEHFFTAGISDDNLH